ncbi:MAG: hypothetical protein WA958_12040 [Tunicatimonas sp.]
MNKIIPLNRLFLMALLSGYLIGCSQKDDPQAELAAPAVPSAATLDMKIYTFSEKDNSNGRTMAEGKLNAFYAGLGFNIWTAILKLQVAVPSVALNEAFKQTPTLTSDGQWLWTYSVEAVDNYQVKLYAKDQGDEQVGWEMYLSKEGFFQDYLWITGTSDRSSKQGQWIVNREGAELMRVDWKKASSDTVTELTYTHLEAESKYEGSYVKYQTLSEGDYNVAYSVYLSNEDNKLNINYHTETLVGRVSNKKHFDDEAWHCWNSDFEDVSCE